MAQAPLNMMIVETLRKYGAVSVDYLASILGRRRSEIEDLLGGLEAEHVVERSDDLISLAKSSTPKQARQAV